MRTVAAVVALVACLNAGLWVLLQRHQAVPDVDGPLASISYTPYSYSRSEHPEDGAPPTAAQIQAELKLLAPYTRSVRTYSATGGVELVPGIAATLGLKTWVGIWLDDRAERDGREIQSAIELARRYTNVSALVVGNETIKTRSLAEVPEIRVKDASKGTVETITLSDIAFDEQALRAEAEKRKQALPRSGSTRTTIDDIVYQLKHDRIDAALRAEAEEKQKALDAPGGEKRSFDDILDDLKAERSVAAQIKILQWVKRHSPVPVTTGQIWSDWRDHPELASAVDFIAAHILPYWEGLPANLAVDQAIFAYDKLRLAHPGKRIVIAEFGWPSAGYNMHNADAGRIEQATVLREFAARAEAYGIDYNIIEAFDQPWKISEGSVGPYWGVFDAAQRAKFAWTGPVSDPDYWRVAGLAMLLGLLFSVPILGRTRATPAEAAVLAIAANTVGAWFAVVFAFWTGHYFVPGAAFAFGLGVMLLVPLVFIALARVEEVGTLAFGRDPRRLITRPLAAAEGYAPKVSIHIPAYREPPEMLKVTLDAIAGLQYPNFECVLVINNTPIRPSVPRSKSTAARSVTASSS